MWGLSWAMISTLDNGMHPPEVDVNPLKMMCGCSCGRVIIVTQAISYPMEFICWYTITPAITYPMEFICWYTITPVIIVWNSFVSVQSHQQSLTLWKSFVSVQSHQQSLSQWRSFVSIQLHILGYTQSFQLGNTITTGNSRGEENPAWVDQMKMAPFMLTVILTKFLCSYFIVMLQCCLSSWSWWPWQPSSSRWRQTGLDTSLDLALCHKYSVGSSCVSPLPSSPSQPSFSPLSSSSL